MNLNVVSVYTYYITQRETCIDLILSTNRLYFERYYTNTFSLPNTCTGAVLNTVKLQHNYFISIRDSCFRSIFNTDRQEAKFIHTHFLISRKLCLNPFSEQIRWMSDAYTRISSLAVSHVNRLCKIIAVCQALNTYPLSWIRSVL